MTYSRLLVLPFLAGALLSAPVVGAPRPASADGGDAYNVTLSCQNGSCSTNDPSGGTADGTTFSVGDSNASVDGGNGPWNAPWNRMPPPAPPMMGPGFGPGFAGPPSSEVDGPGFAVQATSTPPADGPWGPQGAWSNGWQPLHFGGGADCTTDSADGSSAALCNNDLQNTLWIKIDQWGGQLNLTILNQMISQLAASGSGSADNATHDNPMSATVGQSNADSGLTAADSGQAANAN